MLFPITKIEKAIWFAISHLECAYRNIILRAFPKINIPLKNLPFPTIQLRIFIHLINLTMGYTSQISRHCIMPCSIIIFIWIVLENIYWIYNNHRSKTIIVYNTIKMLIKKSYLIMSITSKTKTHSLILFTFIDVVVEAQLTTPKWR